MSYNKLKLIIVFVTLTSCKLMYNESIYTKVEERIIKDSKVLDYTKNELQADKIEIFFSEEIMPFNLSSLEIDVIKKDYIDDFNAFNASSDSDHIIVNKVVDSLYKKDRYLNKDFVKDQFNTIKYKKNIDKCNYIVFFSKVKEQQLFAYLIPYNAQINKTIKHEDVAFGTAFSFLFKLNLDHTIKRVYSDRIHFN